MIVHFGTFHCERLKLCSRCWCKFKDVAICKFINTYYGQSNIYEKLRFVSVFKLQAAVRNFHKFRILSFDAS